MRNELMNSVRNMTESKVDCDVCMRLSPFELSIVGQYSFGT